MKFKIAGPNAGKSGVFHNIQFIDGKAEITGLNDVELQKQINVLKRFYQAYPDPSDALAKAEAEWLGEIKHGNVQVQTQRDDTGGQSEIHGQHEPESAAQSEPADGGNAGNAEAGDPAKRADTGDGQGAQDQKMIDALRSLDPENDDHWTGLGKPSLKAIEAAYGSADVTRKDIEAAIPGFDRFSAQV